MSRLKLPICFLFASICLVPKTSSATEPITNDNIQTAVNAWIANPSDATTTYGAISGWDVSAVTDMQNLFKETSFNDDISNWNVANVKNMFCMFTDATAFNQDISGWDVSSVTNMQRIFQGASDFNSPLDAWGDHIDPTKIVKIAYLFKNAEDFNQPLSSWDVSGVTNMQGMFEGASAFDQDISAWDVSAMLNMNGVFKNAITFNQDLGDWGSKLGQVNNFSYIFNGATSFEGNGIGSWDVSNATNMARMFMNAGNFNSDISSWDVGEATNMERLFLNATNFNQDLSNWCVENIEEEPTSFALNSGLATENYPEWGNCDSNDSGGNGDGGGGDGDGEDPGDGGGNAPPVTLNDFFILEGSDSQAFKTELLTQAISQLNAQLDNSSQVTIMDFLKGKVVNGDVFMEFDLQAIVDAINGEGDDGEGGEEDSSDDGNSDGEESSNNADSDGEESSNNANSDG